MFLHLPLHSIKGDYINDFSFSMAQEQNIENQLKNMQAACNAVASYICPTGIALPWGVTANC